MEQTTGNLSDIVLQCNDISKEFDSFDNSGKKPGAFPYRSVRKEK